MGLCLTGVFFELQQRQPYPSIIALHSHWWWGSGRCVWCHVPHLSLPQVQLLRQQWLRPTFSWLSLVWMNFPLMAYNNSILGRVSILDICSLTLASVSQTHLHCFLTNWCGNSQISSTVQIECGVVNGTLGGQQDHALQAAIKRLCRPKDDITQRHTYQASLLLNPHLSIIRYTKPLPDEVFSQAED